jgi:uncharacterized protein (TIGR01777 family)
MHVAITGSRGLVGSQLIPFLTDRGHRTARVVRGRAGDEEVTWDPSASFFDASRLEGVDAVVHLAGENIASRRWNALQKQRIRDSRVQGTRVLCEGLAEMKSPPKVLVAASATGFYGDRGDEILNEDSPAGKGFLADVCQLWEAATRPAEEAQIRVVNLRIGVVLSSEGGALPKMLTPFKLGGGGIIGNGRQYWSWVAIDDVVGAIHHTLATDALSGPVNAVSPNPLTNREFTKTLGRVVSRPTVIPLPGFVAKLALGEMAKELLLSSSRVVPSRLQESGYEYRHATLDNALRHTLGK